MPPINSPSAVLAALNGTAAAPMVSAFSGAASMVTPQMMQTLMEGLMQGAAAHSSACAQCLARKSCQRGAADCACHTLAYRPQE
jgi:hypothetical protein